MARRETALFEVPEKPKDVQKGLGHHRIGKVRGP
jgi:hypothetical protein